MRPRSHIRRLALVAALAIVAVASALVLPTATQSSRALAQTTTKATVTVGAVGWTDTKVNVTFDKPLVITASGTWTDGDSTVGPNGSTKAWPDNFFNLTDLGVCNTCARTPASHWDALIGYIGNSPPAPGSYTSKAVLPEAKKVFYVGAGYNADTPRTGRLWLAMNADAYSGYTVDNHGQVIATITTPGPTPPSHPDFPWGGYALYPDSGVHVKSVSATWKVPKVNCANGGRTAVWVGMWGKAANSWLPQIGTSSDCSQPFTYTAVYQLPTNGAPWLTVLSGLQYLAAGPQTLLLFPVHAGNQISASVTYEGRTLIGQQKFRIWIKNQDTGQKWSHEITTPIPATLDQVAAGGGAIVEDDSNGLAEFNPGAGHRLDITRLNVTFDRNPAHWTAKPYRIALNGHYLIGPVSKLTSKGSFYVTWKATK